MNGNSFIAWVLRSPLHSLLSGSMLLITVRGRRSGRAITLPVNYVRIGNELWILSSRERTWWRNLRGGASVTLRLRGEEMQAHAEALLDEAVVAGGLGEYVRRLPVAARSLSIRMAGETPDRGDLLRVARERLMVRVRLDAADIDKTVIYG